MNISVTEDINGQKYVRVEQEPNGDVISRDAVIEGLNTINGTAELDKAFEVIERIPPVNPQKPKTGHWIDFERPISKGEWISGAKCDACGYEIGWMFACEWNYCPNCGARMAESEET